MNFKSLNIAITLSLLVSQAYAGKPVSQTQNGINFTAKAMSRRESLNTFGEDLGSYVYPIRLTIRNDSDVLTGISMKSIQVSHAKVLTSKSLKSSIDTMVGATLACAFTIVLIPFAFLTGYGVRILEAQLAIIEKFNGMIDGMEEQTINLNPGISYETFIFPKYECPQTQYQKDEHGNRLRDAKGKELPGKTPPFIAPKSIGTAMEFVTNDSLNIAVNFNLPV